MEERSPPTRKGKCTCQLHYQAATYQIEVVGHLDAQKATWFEGLTLTHRHDDAGTPITRITGEIQDQTALHGLLGRIRDLGLPLLSVRRVQYPRTDRGG